jgi:hypothetical protein
MLNKQSVTDFMGQIVIDLDEYFFPGALVRWFPLKPRPGSKSKKDSVSGEIQLKIQITSVPPSNEKPNFKGLKLGLELPPLTSKMFGLSLEQVMAQQNAKHPELEIPYVFHEILVNLRSGWKGNL